MRWWPLAVLIPVLAGCALSAGDGRDVRPWVTVARDHLHPGDTVTLGLRNPLAEPVGYNACTWTLERRGEAGWDTAPHEDERVCTMELRSLGAGHTAQPRFRLDARLPAGRYRLRVVLHARESGTRERGYSETFRLERD